LEESHKEIEYGEVAGFSLHLGEDVVDSRHGVCVFLGDLVDFSVVIDQSRFESVAFSSFGDDDSRRGPGGIGWLNDSILFHDGDFVFYPLDVLVGDAVGNLSDGLGISGIDVMVKVGLLAFDFLEIRGKDSFVFLAEISNLSTLFFIKLGTEGIGMLGSGGSGFGSMLDGGNLLGSWGVDEVKSSGAEFVGATGSSREDFGFLEGKRVNSVENHLSNSISLVDGVPDWGEILEDDHDFAFVAWVYNSS
jgi:hypothetical protein